MSGPHKFGNWRIRQNEEKGGGHVDSPKKLQPHNSYFSFFLLRQRLHTPCWLLQHYSYHGVSPRLKRLLRHSGGFHGRRDTPYSLIKGAGDRQTEDDHEGFGQCLLAQWSKFSKLPHIPSNCEEADFDSLTSLQSNDRMTPLNLYSRLPGTKENNGNYNYSRALKRDPKT